jgi:hypothetical protein
LVRKYTIWQPCRSWGPVNNKSEDRNDKNRTEERKEVRNTEREMKLKKKDKMKAPKRQQTNMG